MATEGNSPEIGGNIIKFPTPDTLPRRPIEFSNSPQPSRPERGRQNLLKRVVLAGLAIFGIGVGAKVVHDLTQNQPTPIVASKDKPTISPESQPTPQPARELRINSSEAEQRWKEFEKDPAGFMKANPNLIVTNRQAGPRGLNVRKSPGADNDRASSNFDYRLEPNTPIPSLGIIIGRDADGDWVITQTGDGKLRYFNLESTEPIPPKVAGSK